MVKQKQKAIAELRDALSSGRYPFRQTGLSTAMARGKILCKVFCLLKTT
jgi:hypothetical protein